MSFSEMVTSSVLARALALFIVAVTVIVAILVGAVELLRGENVNPIIWAVAGSGVTTAWTIVSINFGVVLQPAPSKPATDTVPTLSTIGGQNANINP